MSKINIQDKTYTTTTVAKSIEIDSAEIKLGESARFMVKLLDENENLVGIERVEISGTDYSNWGSDDQYVIDYILNALGLTEV